MATTYSGAWKRAAVNEPAVRLVAPADPEHANPTPNPNGPDTWVQDTLVPTLPNELVGDQYIQMPAIIQYADMTPQDHGHGLGQGHGQSTLESQDERTDWHAEDLGATDTRRYQPADTRDGSYNVRVLDDEPGQGNSVEYPQMRYDSGVGVSSDPYARVGRRITRWRDRQIDMHRWDPEMRPAPIRNAYSAPEQIPQPNGNQYTSTEPLYAADGRFGVGTPDKFVVPMERRSPRPWDESLTTDGTGTPNAHTMFGLTIWGL